MFHTLVTEDGWNEESLHIAFQHGLTDTVSNALIFKSTRIPSLLWPSALTVILDIVLLLIGNAIAASSASVPDAPTFSIFQFSCPLQDTLNYSTTLSPAENQYQAAKNLFI